GLLRARAAGAGGRGRPGPVARGRDAGRHGPHGPRGGDETRGRGRLPRVPERLRGPLQQRLPAAIREGGARLGPAAEEAEAEGRRRYVMARAEPRSRAVAVVPARLAS